MVKKFLAKTTKGTEFVFSKQVMIAVPEKSAQQICDALNKVHYQCTGETVWHVYDNDWYYNDYINKQIKSYSPKRNIVIHHEYDG